MGNTKKIPHYRLTTVDNKFDPFDEFYEWFKYDSDLGYGSSQLLARIAVDSDELTEEENEQENNRAIDEIIRYIPAIDKYGRESEFKKVCKIY